MDGFKKRLNESVQFKLSAALALAILIVAVIAGVVSYQHAFDEANELQDDLLRQIAGLIDRQHLSAPSSAMADTRVKERDDDSRVIVQKLGDDQSLPVEMEDGPLPVPTSLTDGLYTLTLHGEAFRVLVKTTALGDRIAVSQEADFRDKTARDSALHTVIPFLLCIPVLFLIVADLVRKMFRPIAALSREIDQRAEQELHPIDDSNIPTEIRPFVVAINRLLDRVAQAMDAQRRFVADAAHELRSPMTALSLQAERLAQAEMPALAHERLVVLRRGIDRGRNLLEQLLSLAQAQSSANAPGSSVSVQKLYRHVLEVLMPLAEAKHLDIGIQDEQDIQIQASEPDLATLVKNLVDNAIRYTPDGGRVDLSARQEQGYTVLCVQDSGPGIPLAERKRVFAPFYRTLGSGQIGSGLGLSIVQAITQRLGADIHLDFADPINQTGLRIEVRIPDTPAAKSTRA